MRYKTLIVTNVLLLGIIKVQRRIQGGCCGPTRHPPGSRTWLGRIQPLLRLADIYHLSVNKKSIKRILNVQKKCRFKSGVILICLVGGTKCVRVARCIKIAPSPSEVIAQPKYNSPFPRRNPVPAPV